MFVRKNVDLSHFTTFQCGKIAKQFILAENFEDVEKTKKNYPDSHILGNGSNLLILDNVDTVIKLGPSIPASQNIQLFCLDLAKQGKSGLEFTTGIPATVGGAIKTNLHTKHGNIQDILKETIKIENIIVDAIFETKPDETKNIFRRMRKIHKEKEKEQPLYNPSAGCVFKNQNGYKAAELIEQCHLKGVSSKNGKARISNKHANFVISQANNDPYDILDLILFVQDEVFKQKNVLLELEIELWTKEQKTFNNCYSN